MVVFVVVVHNEQTLVVEIHSTNAKLYVTNRRLAPLWTLVQADAVGGVVCARLRAAVWAAS